MIEGLICIYSLYLLASLSNFADLGLSFLFCGQLLVLVHVCKANFFIPVTDLHSDTILLITDMYRTYLVLKKMEMVFILGKADPILKWFACIYPVQT